MSDAFDVSFDDEADFLAATEAVENGKRRREDEVGINSHKKAKTELSPSTVLANRVLNERFGLDSFRLKQEAAITRLLDGGSATIVFPTGAGKSLCYQVLPLYVGRVHLLKFLGARSCLQDPGRAFRQPQP